LQAAFFLKLDIFPDNTAFYSRLLLFEMRTGMIPIRIYLLLPDF